MSYIIHYQPERDARYPPVKMKTTGKKTAIMAWGAAILLSCVLWGGEIIDFLLPGDPEKTKAAVNTMVEQLQKGRPLGESVSVFCQEILTDEA